MPLAPAPRSRVAHPRPGPGASVPAMVQVEEPANCRKGPLATVRRYDPPVATRPPSPPPLPPPRPSDRRVPQLARRLIRVGDWAPNASPTSAQAAGDTGLAEMITSAGRRQPWRRLRSLARECPAGSIRAGAGDPPRQKPLVKCSARVVGSCRGYRRAVQVPLRHEPVACSSRTVVSVLVSIHPRPAPFTGVHRRCI
jgi:hypothetical protein